jgi:hypothetical protein
MLFVGGDKLETKRGERSSSPTLGPSQIGMSWSHFETQPESGAGEKALEKLRPP